MSSALFTKRGLKTVSYNEEKDKEEIYLEEHPARHINHYCEIEKGVTLKQIMNVVANDVVLSGIMGIYSDVNDIQGWHKELNAKAKRDTELDHIEIFRSGQIWKDHIQIWTEWMGVYKRKHHGSKQADLSYTDLATIANLPVILNKKFKIWGLLQNKKEKPVIDYKADFTLLDVLHPIYYDIGFHGSPTDRKAVKGEMMGTIKGILDLGCDGEGE